MNKEKLFHSLKFGLFIHWGLSSIPGREWNMHYTCKTREDCENYEKYMNYFCPDKFNPEEWAEMAWNAGMRYVVFTTKHHEGFCMFDTKYTDYKITNSPYGKDITKMLVDAFRAKGFKIGLYYSLFDWHHPEYHIDHLHPLRHLPKDEAIAENNKRDMKVYTKYLYNQVEELMTNYGEIYELWFDNTLDPNPEYPYLKGKYRDAWDSENLVKMIRKYQPNIFINNRLDLEDNFDFLSCEQGIPKENPVYKGQKMIWEECQTYNDSWGYFRDSGANRTFKNLLGMLVETASKGGNFLFNIGPTPRGQFEPYAKELLAKFAKWIDLNGESIYGCTEAPKDYIHWASDVFLTYNKEKNRLYAHLLDYPGNGYVAFTDPNNKIEFARFLHDHSELKINDKDTFGDNAIGSNKLLSFQYVKDPGVEIPVVEIFLKD